MADTIVIGHVHEKQVDKKYKAVVVCICEPNESSLPLEKVPKGISDFHQLARKSALLQFSEPKEVALPLYGRKTPKGSR